MKSVEYLNLFNPVLGFKRNPEAVYRRHKCWLSSTVKYTSKPFFCYKKVYMLFIILLLAGMSYHSNQNLPWVCVRLLPFPNLIGKI